MMAVLPPPTLRPFDGSAIPKALKDQPRWAPWKAVYNEKRGKFDKIPHRADVPEYGLSTAAPERWFTFAAALGTYEREQPFFAGVGYVMTHAHGVVGIDLDDCVAEGTITPWALEVVAALDSYTEVSPSGNGLRVFCLGAATDWTNHQVGIEVYGGSAPRFLTITGSHLINTPLELKPLAEGVMRDLQGRYGRDVRKVEVEAVDLPELLDDILLPDLDSLELPYTARDFLTSGEHRGDRSGDLHASAVALYQAGLSDDEVLSVLAANPFAMEVALDHRRQDTERALVYLWKEHCLKAKGKGGSRVATDDDFEDISTPVAQAEKPAPAKPQRFRVESVGEFLQRPRLTWLVKGVLPEAALAVVFGESGSGKTFWVLDLLACVARGVPWRGRKVKQGRGVYICAEGVAGFRNRLEAYCQYHGPQDLPIGVIPDAPNLLERGDVKDLLAAVKTFGQVSVIVVDTFAQVMPGADENSGEDVGRALAHCKALHKATGALVVLIHHSGKDSSKGARGWSGLRAAADAEIEIERSEHDRSATVTKLKDGGDSEEFGFRLETLSIGQDDDGDDISSCVVSQGSMAKAKPLPKGANQRLVLRIAQELLDLADGSVTTTELVDNVIDQIPFDRAAGKKDLRRQHVLQAVQSLVDCDRLSTSGGLVSVL